MKKYFIKFSLILLALTVMISCQDESLDPLQFNSVKKGSILALRGTQLENIYINSLPGAEMFPRALQGDEKFEFDAEFLAEDPSVLESFDVYAIKRTTAAGKTTLTRQFLLNVPFSEFKETEDYRNPWVSVSIDLSDILDAIGQNPASPTFADDILAQYPSGIAIESDLNLKGGVKVLAKDIVAAGLFQSDQFYPAQKLTYTVTNYCPEDLEGTYEYATTVTAVGVGGVISGCAGGVTGEGELVSISRGRYSISDVTFGQYDCAWGDDPATGATLINTCDVLSFGGADQYDLVYTISNVSVSPDGTQLSFNWSNDYGDAGQTVLTRTDDKLWPTTLTSD
jgi:hypothetical protein